MKKTPLQLYADHKAEWLDCERCLLSEHRGKVVLCRGKLPADVLFVGEAPGESEDVLGSPFVGPAGQLLDDIVERSMGLAVDPDHVLVTPRTCDCGGKTDQCPVCDWGLGVCRRCGKAESELDQPCRRLRVAFTNLVACIPHTEEGRKYEVPTEAIKACRPRLVGLATIARPKLVVQVGTLPEKHFRVKEWEAHLPKLAVPKFVKIHHPAYILRSNVADQGLMIQWCEATLSDAVHDLFGG